MANGRYSAAYVIRIHIRVRGAESVVVREGSGTDASNASSSEKMHEFTANAVETNATKLALMTFGLSLYGGGTDPKSRAPPASVTAEITEMPAREEVTSPAADTENVGSEPDASNSATPDSATTTAGATSASLPVTLPGTDWPQISPLYEALRMSDLRRERIDKSELALSEPRRIQNSGHFAFVASKPCLICGRNRAHAHHLKFAQPTALGRKVSDEFTVPLCSMHHRELHTHGDERVWWAAQGIDPLAVAGELWLTTSPRPLMQGRPMAARELTEPPSGENPDPTTERVISSNGTPSLQASSVCS